MNIIAGAVHDGKTVLFVAQRMEALSVVHDRLKKTDLNALCIQIHSRAANKKAFLEELARTLDAGRALPEVPEPPDKLCKARDELNSVSDLLHKTVPGYAFTPFEAMTEIARFRGRKVQPPKLSGDRFASLNKEALTILKNKLTKYATLLKEVGDLSNHPFFGVGAIDLQPTDLDRIKNYLCPPALKVIKTLKETA